MPLANSTLNNSVIKSCPLIADASLQFVSIRDVGTIDTLLKHTPHALVNWAKSVS